MKKIFLLVALTLIAFTGAVKAVTSEAVIWNFTNVPDGKAPQGGVILAAQKKTIYGTVTYGGLNGKGGMFSVLTNGTSYNLFSSLTNNDGSGQVPTGLGQPAGLPVVSGGLIYGIAQTGGAYDSSFGRYFKSGGVFSDSTNGGSLSVIKTFGTSDTDAKLPQGGLIAGTDGAFYGVSKRGGIGDGGVVFRVTASGSWTILHNFINNGDGIWPYSALVQGTNGLLFGTTEYGGANHSGTLFVVNTNGTGYSTIHAFGAGLDGNAPHGALFQVSSGLIYGTCSSGGTNGFGTIWTFDPIGTNYATMKSFIGAPTDGADPEGGLCQLGNGNLLGTCAYGGSAKNCGSLYQIASGTYSQIWNFTNAADGVTPVGNLAAGFDGSVYGVTASGGSTNCGTVFRLIP